MAKKREEKKDENKAKLPHNLIPVNFESTGSTGTAIQNGIFEEEYLGELLDSDSYEVYDKMRRSDYQIKRIILAIYTPLLVAKYAYIPKDVRDEEQVKQADFKNKVLKEWMKKSWPETLNEILSYLIFGFAVFEPTFHVIQTKEYGEITTIKTLGYRKQSTIKEWHLNEDGDIDFIEQDIIRSDHPKDVHIPGDELIVFSNDKEGDNYEGISILRSALGSYKRKNLYLKIDMIGIEKMAIGTPVGYLSSATWDDDKESDKIASVLTSYTSHQKQYLLLPDGLKDGGFEIIPGEYNADAVNNSIKREDLSILGSVLQAFQAIGTQTAGGNSQSDGQMEMFLNSLNYIGQYICGKIDPIINQTYIMNEGVPEEKLTLQCTGINQKDLSGLAKILTAYTKEKIILPDDTLERKVRDDLDLPASEQENADRTKDKKEEPEEPEEEKEEKEELTDHTKKSVHATRKLLDAETGLELQEKRESTEAEKRINLDDVEKTFDIGEEEYEKILRDGIQKMENKYLVDLKNALKQQNRSKAVMNIKIGHTVQLQKEIEQYLKRLTTVSAKQASEEIKLDKKLADDDGIVDGVSSRIKFTSKTVAGDTEKKVYEKGTFKALNGIDNGLSDEEILKETKTELDNYRESPGAIASQGAVVNKYINTGRNNFFFENKELMKGMQFSAILDSRTTKICRSLDKQVFSLNDPKSFTFRPPLHWNCRSILVPITLDMPDPNIVTLKPKPVGGASVSEILKEKQF